MFQTCFECGRRGHVLQSHALPISPLLHTAEIWSSLIFGPSLISGFGLNTSSNSHELSRPVHTAAIRRAALSNVSTKLPLSYASLKALFETEPHNVGGNTVSEDNHVSLVELGLFQRGSGEEFL